VITNRAAYEALCEAERWDTLAALSVDETIAIGEALLASELMDVAEFPDDDHPLNLARALGLRR
jgi:hypothetical protein